MSKFGGLLSGDRDRVGAVATARHRTAHLQGLRANEMQFGGGYDATWQKLPSYTCGVVCTVTQDEEVAADVISQSVFRHLVVCWVLHVRLISPHYSKVILSQNNQ